MNCCLFMSRPLFETLVANITNSFSPPFFFFLSSAMSLAFICRIQPDLPLSVVYRERDMPPCNDPRIRPVLCPGGFAGFYGRYISHVPRGVRLQYMLSAVRIIVRTHDPDTDEWHEVEVYEYLAGYKIVHGVPPSLLYLTHCISTYPFPPLPFFSILAPPSFPSQSFPFNISTEGRSKEHQWSLPTLGWLDSRDNLHITHTTYLHVMSGYGTAGTWEDLGLSVGGQPGVGGGFLSAPVDPASNPSKALRAVWSEITARNVYDSKRVVHMYKDCEDTCLTFPRQAEFFVRSVGGAVFHPFPQ